jgi:hypothetical protein
VLEHGLQHREAVAENVVAVGIDHSVGRTRLSQQQLDVLLAGNGIGEEVAEEISTIFATSDTDACSPLVPPLAFDTLKREASALRKQ